MGLMGSNGVCLAPVRDEIYDFVFEKFVCACGCMCARAKRKNIKHVNRYGLGLANPI